MLIFTQLMLVTILSALAAIHLTCSLKFSFSSDRDPKYFRTVQSLISSPFMLNQQQHVNSHLCACWTQSGWLNPTGHRLKGCVYLLLEHENLVLCCNQEGILLQDIIKGDIPKYLGVQRLTLVRHRMSYLFLTCPMLFAQAPPGLGSNSGWWCLSMHMGTFSFNIWDSLENIKKALKGKCGNSFVKFWETVRKFYKTLRKQKKIEFILLRNYVKLPNVFM